ncbi:hypothetical protein [Limnothrix sp. FACHB-881]|nr:hypothetical protein [Limnothrix sp. FACHB-881]
MQFSWVKAPVTGRSRIHTTTLYNLRLRTGAKLTASSSKTRH